MVQVGDIVRVPGSVMIHGQLPDWYGEVRGFDATGCAIVAHRFFEDGRWIQTDLGELASTSNLEVIEKQF